jgi:hypothetical protein
MLLVYLLCSWNELLVPVGISGLVPTKKKHRDPSWIEGVEYAIRTPLMLHSKLTQILEPRTMDRVGVRTF